MTHPYCGPQINSFKKPYGIVWCTNDATKVTSRRRYLGTGSVPLLVEVRCPRDSTSASNPSASRDVRC